MFAVCCCLSFVDLCHLSLALFIIHMLLFDIWRCKLFLIVRSLSLFVVFYCLSFVDCHNLSFAVIKVIVRVKVRVKAKV